MHLSKLKIALGLTASLLVSTSSFAGKNYGVLDGEYVPVRGTGESLEVSVPALGQNPKQVGSYKVVLKRKDWRLLSDEDKERIKRRLVLKGSFTGEMDLNTFTLDHVLITKERIGALYTQGDFLIPSQGDLACSQGVPLKGMEQMNFVAGSGYFANLVSGNLLLQAEVNNCPGALGFGQNNFTVTPDQGSLIFAAQE